MDIKSVTSMRTKLKESIGELYADSVAEAGVTDVSTHIIRVAAILIIGVVILNGVAESAGLQSGDAFYTLSQNVIQNIESGYTLAALMVLALGASAIMRYMGFM